MCNYLNYVPRKSDKKKHPDAMIGMGDVMRLRRGVIRWWIWWIFHMYSVYTQISGTKYPLFEYDYFISFLTNRHPLDIFVLS